MKKLVEAVLENLLTKEVWIFGTSYPWIAAADIADDGSILVVMSDTRADESADEVLVFKLSGF